MKCKKSCYGDNNIRVSTLTWLKEAVNKPICTSNFTQLYISKCETNLRNNGYHYTSHGNFCGTYACSSKLIDAFLYSTCWPYRRPVQISIICRWHTSRKFVWFVALRVMWPKMLSHNIGGFAVQLMCQINWINFFLNSFQLKKDFKT